MSKAPYSITEIELYYRRGCGCVGFCIHSDTDWLVEENRQEAADQLRRLADAMEQNRYPFHIPQKTK